MSNYEPFVDNRSIRHRLRLSTLTRLRWLAVAGQSIAVIIIAHGYGFPMPELFCFVMIACSAWLNIFLSLRFPPSHHLPPAGATSVLSFDVIQLASLLFMTGGIANPFAVLICVPVIISAASQPVPYTLGLGGLALTCLTVISYFSLPLPWHPGVILEIPFLLAVGNWIAIVSTTAFAAIYAYQVSAEGNELADALTAAELILQREHHLSALDGLAAAAAHELGTPLATISVVAKEMQKGLAGDPRYAEDVDLLRSQAERCRDILRRLSSLSTTEEEHMRLLPLTSLIEEIVEPHREFGIAISVKREGDGMPEPVGLRNPGILYGLGNILENAVDFAKSEVRVSSRYDRQEIAITVSDDGPGYSPDTLARIGLPFRRSRDKQERQGAGGLGLGLFIAKTLLERSGAELVFENVEEPAHGARVTITWPRERMDIGPEAGKYRPGLTH